MDICSDFLQQNLFSYELQPFQQQLAKFIEKLGYKIDVNSVVLLGYLLKPDEFGQQ